ncbi:replication protein [Candidatus Chlorohelix sp.]|uniref:replication protein n=1 Tax=Candidatus Chlorohelix sp. TaxID=3139201 RepID=UPI00303AAA2D
MQNEPERPATGYGAGYQFDRIPSVFSREQMRTLSGSAVKVALAIFTHTAGFNKTIDAIAQKQLAELTGLTINSVKKAITELAQTGVIFCHQRGNKGRTLAAVYELNLTGASSYDKANRPKPHKKVSKNDTLNNDKVSNFDTTTYTKTNSFGGGGVILGGSANATTENNALVANITALGIHHDKANELIFLARQNGWLDNDIQNALTYVSQQGNRLTNSAGAFISYVTKNDKRLPKPSKTAKQENAKTERAAPAPPPAPAPDNAATKLKQKAEFERLFAKHFPNSPLKPAVIERNYLSYEILREYHDFRLNEMDDDSFISLADFVQEDIEELQNYTVAELKEDRSITKEFANKLVAFWSEYKQALEQPRFANHAGRKRSE